VVIATLLWTSMAVSKSQNPQAAVGFHDASAEIYLGSLRALRFLELCRPL